MKTEFQGMYTKKGRGYCVSPEISKERPERFCSLPFPETGERAYIAFSAADPQGIVLVTAEKIVTETDHRGSSQIKVYAVSDVPPGSAEIAAAILTNLCKPKQIIRATAEEICASLTLLLGLPSTLKEQVFLSEAPGAGGAMQYAANAALPTIDPACRCYAEQPSRYAAAFARCITEAARSQTLTQSCINKCMQKAVGLEAEAVPYRPVKPVQKPAAPAVWQLDPDWNQNPLLANAALKFYAGGKVRLQGSNELWRSASAEMIAQFAAAAVVRPELAEALPPCTGQCADLDASLRALCRGGDDAQSRLIKGYMLAYLPSFHCAQFAHFWQTREERTACARKAFLRIRNLRERIRFYKLLRRNLPGREKNFLLLRMMISKC